jgi:methylmalonyl-CoA mutase, C-terminal domain
MKRITMIILKLQKFITYTQINHYIIWSKGFLLSLLLNLCYMSRPIRVLVAKVGLDGHDRGAKVIATALRDAGMEVIYTGLRQTPEMLVNAALQEDVDAIGISILSGAHNTIFPKVINLMKEKGMKDVLLTGGGIIPDDDMKSLNELGVGKLFAPGATTTEIADYIRAWVKENRPF